MDSRAARLAWAGATLALAIAATFLMWRSENQTWRVDFCCAGGVPLDPYYLTLFSWTPLVSLGWLGAGAVVLARRVRYRGFWYMAPQVLIMVTMAIRLAAIGMERGFPEGSSLGAGTMTPIRWGMVLLGGLTLAASVAASIGCLSAAVSYRSGEPRM